MITTKNDSTYPIPNKTQQQDKDNNSKPENVEYSSCYEQIYQLNTEILSFHKDIDLIEKDDGKTQRRSIY